MGGVRCKLQLCDTRIGRIMHKIRSLVSTSTLTFSRRLTTVPGRGLSINARYGRTFAVPGRCWRADVAPNPAIPPFKMMGWITRTLRQEVSDSADYDSPPIFLLRRVEAVYAPSLAPASSPAQRL